ncbi:Os11g0133850 [Oryza sativa Japonica Group]|uniref:Os11g0133850 protein n=1 Tax=Oryza sativa subsp. japonica TaxID=39947 RepID=A0A0P0XYK0_ORYSJ|nr:hypothetical protein EE612_053347 [Oryza sativa]BAT12548.1 Os11g0133850 [Oryza sativa Japonica Group]
MFEHLHLLVVPKLKQKALVYHLHSCSCHLDYLQRNHSLCSEALLGSAYPPRVYPCFPSLNQSFPLDQSNPAQYMEYKIQLPVRPHLPMNRNCSVVEGSW